MFMNKDIKVMWENEDALSLQARRARYKCKNKFTTLSDIQRWTNYEIEFVDHAFDKSDSTISRNEVHKIWFCNKFDVKEPNVYARWKPDAEINSKVALWQGDITSLELDAIVNAANTSLLGGGGVDGAIHSAAGGELYKECILLNGCQPGSAKITRGYNLPAKYVIATVGPVGEKPQVLHDAYYNSLQVAKANGVRTLAFCGISTGIYSYPLYAATHIAMATVRSWLQENKEHVGLIVFCTFLAKEQYCYQNLMPLYFPKHSTDDSQEETTQDSTQDTVQEESIKETSKETSQETQNTTTAPQEPPQVPPQEPPGSSRISCSLF